MKFESKVNPTTEDHLQRCRLIINQVFLNVFKTEHISVFFRVCDDRREVGEHSSQETKFISYFLEVIY